MGSLPSSRAPLWFAIFVLLAAYFFWSAVTADGSWVLPLVLAIVAIAIAPRRRGPGAERVEVDDTGVRRGTLGTIREEIAWKDVHEIRIITTDAGPWSEDVFFVLLSADGKGCTVPNDAAVEMHLMEALQSRFPDLDNELVIQAMVSTSNNSFVIWKAPGTTS